MKIVVLKSAAKEWTRLYASGAWWLGGNFWPQITIVEVYAINCQIEMEIWRNCLNYFGVLFASGYMLIALFLMEAVYWNLY